MELWDQISSWILVALCFWIVHQTNDPCYADGRKCYICHLMRIGLAGLGIVVAIGSIFTIYGLPFNSSTLLKTAINVMLLLGIVFYKKRYGKI